MSENEGNEVEEQARLMGWKPEAEWKGAPPKHGFVSAEDFVETGKRVLPVVSAENKRLKERLDQQDGEIAALKQGNARFKVFTDKAIDREKAEKQAAIDALEGKRAKAIDDSDGATAVAAEKEIRTITKELDDIPTEDNGPDPAVEAWVAKNPWYKEDLEVQAVTDGLSIALGREQPSLVGVPHLEELEKRVKAAMPHKFKNPKRNEPDSVAGGVRTPQGGDAKTFENLPAAAKREFEEFAETIPGFTKEAYVEQYEW